MACQEPHPSWCTLRTKLPASGKTYKGKGKRARGDDGWGSLSLDAMKALLNLGLVPGAGLGLGGGGGVFPKADS